MKDPRHYWIIPALLFAVLFFGCDRKPGEKLYTEAMAQWKAGHHVRARALLEKSIRRRPGDSGNADAYNRLGLLLWEMDEVDSAVEAFQESCRIDAGQYGPLCNLGVAQSAQNNFTGAEEAFREAALLQPNDPRPLTHAALAYMQNEKWDDAERNLRRALERTPSDPQIQTLMALTELHTQDAGTAIRYLRSVIHEHPTYTPALFNLASIQLHHANNPVLAKQAFESYLNQPSATGKFAIIAQKCLKELSTPVKKPGLVISPPKKRDRKTAWKIFQKALALHRAGQPEKAIAGYTQALETDDSYERAFYNLGLAYYATGKMGLAGESFTRAVDLNPAFADARYNAALVDYHLNRTDRALSELSIVLTQQPDYQPAIDLLERIKAE